MSHSATVQSPLRRGVRAVGRKPSKNPLSTLLSFRIDEAQTKALDAEMERMLRETPGLMLSRGDMARILVVEALESRAKRRSSKK